MATKLTPEQAIALYTPMAKEAQAATGLNYLILLTQASQESAYFTKMPGNNPFGVKDTDGVNGNEVLVVTTEFSKYSNVKYKSILKKVFTGGLYKYTIADYFVKYPSVKEAFMDHVEFFERNPRYKEALKHKMEPEKFFDAIAAAKYATDPHYASNLKAVMRGVIKRLPK